MKLRMDGALSTFDGLRTAFITDVTCKASQDAQDDSKSGVPGGIGRPMFVGYG
jgi:hypothetical protein